MIEWLKEMLHFLQFIYNNLLIFENYDKIMTPPIEGAFGRSWDHHQKYKSNLAISRVAHPFSQHKRSIDVGRNGEKRLPASARW